MSTHKITEDELREWWELEQRRGPLQREVAQIEKRQKAIADPVKEALTAEGRVDARRGIFKAQLTPGQVRPKWQEEFLALAGPDKVKEIQDATPPGQRLTVVRLEGEE